MSSRAGLDVEACSCDVDRCMDRRRRLPLLRWAAFNWETRSFGMIVDEVKAGIGIEDIWDAKHQHLFLFYAVYSTTDLPPTIGLCSTVIDDLQLSLH